MKWRTSLLFSAYVFLLLLPGCSSEDAEPEAAEVAEAAEATEAEAKIPKAENQDTPAEEKTLSREEDEKAGKEEDLDTSEAMQISVREGRKPEDTVPFVESDRKEMTEIQMEESTVDEEDPDSYQIVLKEKETTVSKEIPEEYTDNVGNVVYEYVDGNWCYYEYSSGDVVLDEPDEEFALFLLNLDGSYEDYEIYSIRCEEKEEDGAGILYAYHVLYRKVQVMTEEPENVEQLHISRSREETVVETVSVEEKIPVSVEKEIGTGEYVYYGWQNLDGNTYYFDGDGNKVTGSQVLRGIRYEFDSEGVLRSRAGIDVSGRNGEIDWGKVKEAGVDFAMIRAGYRGCLEGMLLTDDRCTEYLQGASDAGLETGVYFFSQAVNEEEAVEEADLVLNMISGYSISMPVGIYTEYELDKYRTRTDSLNVPGRTSCVRAFCRRISDAGYTPVICGSRDWLSERLDMSVLDGYPVWLSEYDSNVTYTEPFMIWQYTAQGELDGISGTVNMDISYGK